MSRWIVIVAAFMALSTAFARADYAVGKTELTVSASTTAVRGDHSGKLHILVWYPAKDGSNEEADAIGSPAAPNFLAGKSAPDAPIATTPHRFPLIVISHGTGGAAIQMAWLATRLAADGYIAAAVDHPGNNFVGGYTASGFSLWWLRADDLSKTIDAVLADPRFRSSVDPIRIGAAGFSLGGYSVLELAGARTSLDRFSQYCARTHWSACDGPPELPHSESDMRKLLPTDAALRDAVLHAGDSYRDARVKAVFAIAPAVVTALVPSTLSSISIPTFVVAGFGDPLVSVADNAIPAASAIPNARLFLFPRDVGHYTFLDECTEFGRKQSPGLCPNTADRQRAVHERTAALAGQFFSEYL